MDVLIVFTILAIILIIGFLSELLFQKTGIPDVLIMILIGMGLKYFFGVSPDQFGNAAILFTTFALIYILFQGSMQIHFATLLQTMNETLRVTVISFILSVSATTGILYLLSIDILTAILIGTITGGISIIVIIPIVTKIQCDSKIKSSLTLESSINDILCIIGTIIVVKIITSGEIITSTVFQDTLSLFALGVFVGFIVGFGWVSLLNKIKWLGHENLLTIAVILLLYSFVESPFVQASGAIAVLTFGIIVGNSRKILEKIDKKHSHKLFSNSALTIFSEISFFLKVIFFVYLGIVLDLTDWRLIFVGAAITSSLFLIRPIAIYLSFTNSTPENKKIQNVLIPRGLAAAVLAQFAVIELGFTFISTIAFSVIFFSIVISSFLIFIHYIRKPIHRKNGSKS